MTVDSKSKYKLRRFVEELEQIRAPHTELISVYIPAGYDLNKIIQHLQEEQSTARNIKSKTTQNNVINALERMIRHLRLFKKTPDNGMAVFSGNVLAKEGKQDYQVWSMEPPVPISTRLYRCDQTFVIDILKQQTEHKETYGLIVMDRREVTLGLLKGSTIIELTHLTSGVPGKMKAGGQCLHPDTIVNVNNKICKLGEVKVGDKILGFNFKLNKIEETICKNVWNVKKDKILIIILDNKKSIIASKDHLFYVKSGKKIIEISAEDLSIKDKLINSKGKIIDIKKIECKNINRKLIDIETKSKNFIANGVLVHNSSNRFRRIIEQMAHDFYKRIGEIVNKEFGSQENMKGILVGGPGNTKIEFIDGDFMFTELKNKIVAAKDLSYTGSFGLNELVEKSQDTLSQEIITKEKQIINNFLTMLAKQPEKTAYGIVEVKKALERGAVDTLIISESMDTKAAEELEKIGEESGAKVEFISTETNEGMQLKNLGGVGAILRYQIS